MADKQKMGFNASWSMAVGGMVGGGIFSVLGVVVGVAAQWAWLSFVISGIIALISAYSYSQLANKFGESGGAFSFLRKMQHEGLAGSLSWILIAGYILTISVYGFTFGHYVSHVFSAGSWLPRVLALVVIAALTFINLRGVGDASKVEIVTVWGKMLVLLGLALLGIFAWAPEQLTAGVGSKSISQAFIGAATIFMAYEGFQLLSYDYKAMENAEKTLPRASIIAVISVIAIYVLVALGATMLVGADIIVKQKEVALAVAGKAALGTVGLVLVTIAAAFSTASAINATLFSTALLMEKVAKKKELPASLAKENEAQVPYFAIIVISIGAAALAMIGSLGSLVEAASLIFLITFGVVNYLAFEQGIRYRWLCTIGVIGAGLAIIISVWRFIQEYPIALAVIVGLMLFAVVARPFILKQIKK